jgi:transposase InsO family protein
MIYAFIEAEKADFPISFMCHHLGVSPSGFYEWRARPPSARAVADAALTDTIRQVHRDSRGTYGSPRVHAELRLGPTGVRCGRKRVERLMRLAGLQGVHRRRRQGCTQRAEHPDEVAEDLVGRRFEADAPDRLWVADVTQQRCWDGWFYLAVVIDVYTRMVVGWSMADHLRAELVVDALDMAVWRRRPAPGGIHHSDHGAQYTSWVFGNRLREAGLLASLGSVGDCYDNAMAESFFATLETELFDRRSWPTRRELGTAVFDYLEGFYNPTRRHSALGYHSPASYEAAWRARQAEPVEPAA